MPFLTSSLPCFYIPLMRFEARGGQTGCGEREDKWSMVREVVVGYRVGEVWRGKEEEKVKQCIKVRERGQGDGKEEI